MVPRNAQASDVLEELQKKANISNEVMSNVRLYEVHSNKFLKTLPSDYHLMTVNDYVSLFAAPFPEDDSSKTIPVFHFDKEPAKTHGVPFEIPLKEVCIYLACSL